MSQAIERTADVVVYQGRALEVLFVGENGPAVRDDGGDFPPDAPRGVNSRGSWVEISEAELERKYHRRVEATWDGARVIIMAVSGSDVLFLHTLDPRWAREHGLEGSEYEGGWTGRAPISELEDLTVTEAIEKKREWYRERQAADSGSGDPT